MNPLPYPPVKRVYETKYAEVRGEPNFRMHLGVAYRHIETNDVYVIVAVIYPKGPTQAFPSASGCIVRRNRDDKQFERSAEVMKEQITGGHLIRDDRHTENHYEIKIEISGSRLIMRAN